MDIKSKLRRIRSLNQEINACIAERQSLYNSFLKSPQLKSDYVHGGKQVSLEDKYLKVIEMGEEINRKVDQLIDLKIEVSHLIDQLEDVRYRNVLRSYYLTEKTWEQVAVDNHWSYQHTMRLHGQALKELQEEIK
ncbi:DUF1492 domain-containing protein [Aerococcus mictus]|uniref:DUF1492 domain-containing protein n=1 Tax=Aerococcus TaxID=1375 RepID=UPI0018A70EB1|nr:MULTISPECIES: DUF1492 domain-containing protein [Aerococcus]MDK7716040.1 DUF1492 domain-containing protein [Aerococcus urinae]MDK8655454.1 DUF1492 domain-containing protein [Aerococcus urinae]